MASVFIFYQLYSEEGNLEIRAEEAKEHSQQALLHKKHFRFFSVVNNFKIPIETVLVSLISLAAER